MLIVKPKDDSGKHDEVTRNDLEEWKVRQELAKDKNAGKFFIKTRPCQKCLESRR